MSLHLTVMVCAVKKYYAEAQHEPRVNRLIGQKVRALKVNDII